MLLYSETFHGALPALPKVRSFSLAEPVGNMSSSLFFTSRRPPHKGRGAGGNSAQAPHAFAVGGGLVSSTMGDDPHSLAVAAADHSTEQSQCSRRWHSKGCRLSGLLARSQLAPRRKGPPLGPE